MIYQRGSSGAGVAEIQRALGVRQSGEFDDATLDAVRMYQNDNRLVVDGIVGPMTLKALRMKYSRTRKISDISVHCSATKAGEDFGAADFRKWHKRRGWSDIGYHYVIRLDGKVEKGRPLYKIPAAVRNRNSEMVAICYTGGLNRDSLQPEDTRTDAQKASMRELLIKLKNKFPAAVIRGHRDYPNVAKACPCFDVMDEYADL